MASNLAHSSLSGIRHLLPETCFRAPGSCPGASLLVVCALGMQMICIIYIEVTWPLLQQPPYTPYKKTIASLCNTQTTVCLKHKPYYASPCRNTETKRCLVTTKNRHLSAKNESIGVDALNMRWLILSTRLPPSSPLNVVQRLLWYICVTENASDAPGDVLRYSFDSFLHCGCCAVSRCRVDRTLRRASGCCCGVCNGGHIAAIASA